MPIYRLTPLQGTENSPHWRASSLRPQCLWIMARDEYEAREAIARATAVPSAAAGLFPPWNDKALVACEYDDDADVPRGIIRVRTGITGFRKTGAAQSQRLSPGHAG